jgi:hypothetical protein
MSNENAFNIGEPDVENGSVGVGADGSERKKLGMVKENTLVEIAAGCLALVSMITALTSMVIASGFFVNCAGVLAIALGPYSYWQQRNITDIKTLQETHEALVREVDHLGSENERLKGVIGDLTGSVDKLEGIEDTFDQISEMNIQSIGDFKEQVEESKLILGMMKTNLKASALQNVITVVLNSDNDGDYTFCNTEVETLIDNLKAINGLEMDEMKFRSVISVNDGSVDAVVMILNDIIHAQEQGAENEHEGIFKLAPSV